MSSSKIVAQCGMASLLRKIIGLVALWSIQIDNGKAGFDPLSPHCLLVDVDIYYAATRVGNVDLHETTNRFKNSSFIISLASNWPGQQESCGKVDVSFDKVVFKEISKSGDLVLAATFMYRFKYGAEKNPSDKKLRLCIDATRKEHEEHLKKYNWLASIPVLKGKNGVNVKAKAAPYDNCIKHCCVVKELEMPCCSDGAIFVPRQEGSSCECRAGYYYNPAIQPVCQPCTIDTYQPKQNSMENCLQCPEGKMTLGNGSLSCLPIVECKEEVLWTVEGTFVWETTRVNHRAKHKCPYGPSNVTVTRVCNLVGNKTASWAKFDSFRCTPSKHTETLLELSKIPIDETNVDNITEVLVKETAVANELDFNDITLATDTIVNIVDYNSSLTEVAENVVKVINNILSVQEDVLAKSQLLNHTASRLINATEIFAENVPLENGVFSYNASNIEMKGQAITHQSLDDDFVYITNSKKQRQGFLSTNQQQITITAKALQKAKQQGSDRIVTIVYQNNKLFPVFINTKSLKSEKQDEKGNKTIEDIVLMGKFKDTAIDGLEGAIELKFSEDLNNGSRRRRPHCVFWDFRANDGFGNWSTEGCYYSGTTSGHVTCRCNHMTNFAILLTADPDRDEQDLDHKHALSVISYVGCTVSLLAAILTFITYTFFRDLRRSNAQTILCHLCIALIGLLLSYFVVANQVPKTTGCLVSSLFVHYFLLATFFWMGVEGTNMYLAFVKVMSAHVPRFIPKAVIIAWGIPVLVVIITGALASDDYSSEESCFLHGLPFYISVFTPAVIVLLMNFIMFALTMYSLSQMGKEVSQENKMKGYRRVKVAMAIMVLLGLTWFFGMLAIGSARLLFQYLFCIFNSLQGFAIFWFHCVRQPEVRQCWADYLRGRRGRQRRYTASTTAPVIGTNVKKTSSTASPKLKPSNTRRKHNEQNANSSV